MERWLAAEKQRLLPVSHFHVVFTIPHELNDLWRWNRTVFGSILFRAAAESLLQLLADRRYLGARPGLLLTLHTWTQQLTLHPHIHALVTAGGMNERGQWVDLPGRRLLPGRVLMSKFRGKLRAMLLQALQTGRLVCPAGMSSARVIMRLNRLGRQTLNVRIREQYAHGHGVATYLARYLRGGPISNRRIVAVSRSHVTFRYRDRTQSPLDAAGEQRRATLPVSDFLQRYVEHIPTPRFHMVRRYGIYAGSLQHLLHAARSRNDQQEPSEPSRRFWFELLAPIDPIAARHGLCPVCQAPLECRRLDPSTRASPVFVTSPDRRQVLRTR